jgi:hypothetical protein
MYPRRKDQAKFKGGRVKSEKTPGPSPRVMLP